MKSSSGPNIPTWLPCSTILRFFTRTSADIRKRRKRICVLWPFERKRIRPRTPTLHSQSAISPWSIIRGAITRERRNSTALHLRAVRKPPIILLRITRSLLLITPICCDRSARRAKRTNSKRARAKSGAHKIGGDYFILRVQNGSRNVIGPFFSRSRGGMADAYGSEPYGETRGGSNPLVSNSSDFVCTFAEYLSTFAERLNKVE